VSFSPLLVPQRARLWRSILASASSARLGGKGRGEGGSSVLRLFLRGASLEPALLPRGDAIPPHDGSGSLHFAFAIPRGSDGAWETHLRNAGITIESTVTRPRGGRSLYFRDPDGHLVELLTPGVWEPC
jgi:catechol 2,3-dioxygenase-like lactoylglutathione lyase family enzyme